ncbi:MAG: RIO1 family regulatory kinase/ATPase domain-containing protein [Candidatus Thorarchaeota archaeon]|jgi:RIO kinase 1
MAGIVEKLNPRKPDALSMKRDAQRGNKRGWTVQINEITLEEVKVDAVKFGLATEVLYQMNAGKEASIYLARWKDHPIILKAFRFWNTSQAKKKKGYFAPGRMQVLAAKEYDLLSACFKAGMKVPTPIGRVGNYLTMRFIGDGVDPSPQLRTVQLEDPELVLDQILDDYLVMYRDVNYVHGDLSAYNILWWQDCPWIIDMPQAVKVGPWSDMKSVVSLLRRDIINVLRYFRKYGIRRDAEEILNVFLSEYIPHNQRNFTEEVARF